jgi:PAS domain S-box-containing protein
MPIYFEDKTVGAIGINSFKKNAFDREELKLLENIAQQIKIAISNAKQAEALRISEEKFRNLVEHTNDMVWETDTKGAFTYVNPKAYDLIGYEPGEILGKTTFDFMTGDEAERFSKVVEVFISEQKPFPNLEKTLFHKDGHPVFIETSGSPIFDSQGVLQGYHGIARNITQRKKMEEEFLRIQKLESLGVLAGGIAHDFNNLLTGILGNISLVKKGSDFQDKSYRRLDEAERASLRAKDLTGQLLTFSKGGVPIKEVASVGKIIADSASFALRGSNVRCEFNMAEDLWLAEVDEGQISQVLNNLVINAQQAMPQGGVIRVKAENVNLKAEEGLPLKEGRYVKITVEDKGIGIPKEHLSKVFDPYFTTKQKGSGLGLAIVHSIIKNHNGYIGVESEIGVGTRFHIYLPACDKNVSELAGVGEESVIEGVGRILIMDDEELVRGILSDMLGQLGYEVEFTSDGRRAIELYREAKESDKPFDVVIMDLTIPGGMGGKEAIGKLLEVDPNVKAVVSSGYSNDPVMSEYGKYGFKGVVSKPYKIEELSKTVHEVKNGKQ